MLMFFNSFYTDNMSNISYQNMLQKICETDVLFREASRKLDEGFRTKFWGRSFWKVRSSTVAGCFFGMFIKCLSVLLYVAVVFCCISRSLQSSTISLCPKCPKCLCSSVSEIYLFIYIYIYFVWQLSWTLTRYVKQHDRHDLKWPESI